MAPMNAPRPEPMKAWVECQAAGGRYGNASDYDLIRSDQQRAEAIATLQATITEGGESGEPQPLVVDAFKRRMRERHAVR